MVFLLLVKYSYRNCEKLNVKKIKSFRNYHFLDLETKFQESSFSTVTLTDGERLLIPFFTNKIGFLNLILFFFNLLNKLVIYFISNVIFLNIFHSKYKDIILSSSFLVTVVINCIYYISHWF
jgi:hypothetical protein